MEVKFFILLSGQQLIGKLKVEDDKFYHVEDAYIVEPQHDTTTGRMGLSIRSVVFASKTIKFKLNKSLIITTADVKESLLKEYLEKTSIIKQPSQQEKNIILMGDKKK